MAAYRSLRDMDWTLLSLTVAICGIGILQIYSATHETVWKDAWWKQMIWVFAGLVVVWILSAIDYHTLLGQVPLFYLVGIGTLLATFFVGRLVFGSRRWIPLFWGFHFQTSDFVKVVIILLVALYLTELKNDLLELPDLLKLGGLVGLPMVMVMLQPDLGTSLTYLPILVGGVFLVGLRWQYWVAILLLVALVLPLGWFVLKDYQKARLVTFMDPSRDPRGSGY
ncbi:MAG: FtsW/RodA/SpoVE family cell cycle protein, partial [Bryobacterales bacterium]|nr:FtsW/RodA/SpoVE family cell cycle protein [Bryobacterales bacterium]